jgi:hypothetical protein
LKEEGVEMRNRPVQRDRTEALVLAYVRSETPYRVLTITIGIVLCLFLIASPVFAGPPFLTDDPETLEYQNWEFYVASQYANDKDGVSGTAPHIELNYGVLPNVQLHLIVPSVFDKPRGGPTLYGPGDAELGVKYRFIQEGDYIPMVGVFPILHLPTGNQNRGLGNGDPQLFLPLWLQKSLGPWTSYGGGGYWLNPGTDNKNFWFFGWLLQRDITEWLTVGGEIFYQTPSTRDGDYQTGYNLGSIINFTDNHHFLLSAGSDIRGPNLFRCYVAYLLTWGPPEKKK